MHALLLFVVVLALAWPVSAVAAPPPAGTAATATVQVGAFFFRPGYSRIEPGDTVTWNVLSGSPHTVTSRTGAPEAFGSGELLAGGTFSRAFPTAGRYPYHCTIHPQMRGVVQVGPDTVAPVVAKPKAKVGKKSVRLAFRLSEGSKVSATATSITSPNTKPRRTKAKRLQDGKRSLTIKRAGLKPGVYRVVISARDPEGNVGKGKTAFKILQPRR